LGVAHHAIAGGFDHPGELAAGNERWRRSAAVSAAGRKRIGKVDAHRFHADDHFARFGLRVRQVAYFENFGTTGTSDDDGFHAFDFTMQTALLR
jgi:hypothetical protein